jgi:hypothetical protein
LLVCPSELSLGEQASLNRHLHECAECRGLAALYAGNRSRLRSLMLTRPPERLREAVVVATEESRCALASSAPILFAFLIIPLTLVALGVVITLGAPGLLAVLGGSTAICVLTVWHVQWSERGMEMPLERARWNPLTDVSRLAIDIIGLLLGLLILGLVLWLGSVVSQSLG